MQLTLRSIRSMIPTEVFLYGGAIALVCALMFLVVRGQFNLLVMLMLLSGVLLVSFVWSRSMAILITQGYLYLMGDLRRVCDVFFGFPPLDLLLLVAPAVVLLMALPLFLRLRVNDALSKAVLYLTGIMILEVFNPKQGGLAVGFAGAMFYLVPVFWFWIGRAYGTTELVEKLLYKVLFPIAIVSALLGLVQTYVGLLPYERAWADVVRSSGTYIITIGAETRAFGFSVSVAEFIFLLTMASVGCLAAAIGGRRVWILPVPLLLTAMFLASSRGAVFKGVFAIVITWTLRKAQKLNTLDLVRLVVFGVIGFSLVIYTASRFADSDSSNAKQATLISHQLGGLAHPLDSRYSTAQVHNQIVTAGIMAGFTYPIGRGLGSTTTAASKLGVSGEAQNAEVDFSDAFITMGLPGGFVYLFIVFTSLRYVLEYIRFVPRYVGLPMLAIVTMMLGSWLIAGQYSTSATLMFLIGCVVREREERLKTTPFIRISCSRPERLPAVVVTA